MTDAKLLQAILAMDAYNQGAIKAVNTGEGSISSLIGSATVIKTSGASNAGFSATAYQIGTVIVISYRGTDFNTVGGFLTDAANWAGGLGWETEQAKEAAAFYHSVVNEYGDNVVLTGHSLGGGLAGLMATLYGKNAIVFDSMAFELSASNVYQNATTPMIYTSGGVWIPNSDYQPTLDTYYGGLTPPLPDGSHIGTIQVSGQVIDFNSPSGATFDDVLQSGADSKLGSIDLHSISLLAVLRYAEINPGDWSLLQEELILSLFNEELASAASIGRVDGYYSDANKMRSMIAYTAIDDGPTPFGNVAIRSLFNDADDIAQVAVGADEGTKTILGNFVEIATQYSGLLAYEKQTDASLIAGIATHNQTTVTLDTSAARWGNINVSGRIVGLENALFNVIAATTSIMPFSGNLVALQDLFGGFTNSLLSGLSTVKATNSASVTLNGTTAQSGALLIGLTGSGENTFTGGIGTNVLASSGDSNVFDLSKGNNIVLMGDSGTAVLDTAASSDPVTSQNWNMVQGTSGQDTFKFTGTERAPLTIVYGGDASVNGGLNDTYDFNVGQGSGASIYLLQMDELNAQNFLSLDPQKIGEYIGQPDEDNDGNYYGGGADRIVIINPDQNDILKYNNEIIGDPTRYQKSIDTYNYKMSSEGDIYAVNPDNIFEYVGPYDPDSGSYGAYLTRAWEEYTDITKEFSLKSNNTDLQLTFTYGGNSGLYLNKIQSDLQTVTDSYDSYTALDLINGRFDTETTTYYSEVDQGTASENGTVYKGLQLTGFSNGDFGVNIGSDYGPQTISDSTMLHRFVTDWNAANFGEGYSLEFERWFQVAVGTDPKTFGETIDDYQEHYEGGDYNAYLLNDPDYQRQNLSVLDFKRDQSPAPDTPQGQRQAASASVGNALYDPNDSMVTANQPIEASASPWKSEDERVSQLKEKGLAANGKPRLEQLALLAGIAASQSPSLNNGHWNKQDGWQDNLTKHTSRPGDLGAMPDAGIKLLNVLFNKEEIKLFANAIPGTSSLQMADGTTLLVSEPTLSYGRA